MRYGAALRSRAALLPGVLAASVMLLTACASGPGPQPGGSASTTAASPTSSAPAPSSTSSSPTASGGPTSASPSGPSGSATLTGFVVGPVEGGTPWPGPEQARLVRVAAGRHDGFDRLVLEFAAGPVPSYEVTTQAHAAFRRDPSDAEVVLDGDSGVRVVVRGTVVAASAAEHLAPAYPALREVERIGDFEAVVSYGAGVSGVARVRVTTLASPARLVVDVLQPGATGA